LPYRKIFGQPFSSFLDATYVRLGVGVAVKMDDLLYYCNDILTLGVPQLAAHVSRILWTDLLEPLLLPAAARATPPRTATTVSAPQSSGLTRVPSLGRYALLAFPLRVLLCACDARHHSLCTRSEEGGVISISCCHNDNDNNKACH
jgi:hypothetical protein